MGTVGPPVPVLILEHNDAGPFRARVAVLAGSFGDPDPTGGVGIHIGRVEKHWAGGPDGQLEVIGHDDPPISDRERSGGLDILTRNVLMLAGGIPGMNGATDEPLARHHFAAYNIAAFTDLDEFKASMDRMLDTLAETRPAPGYERVVYPGLMEHETEIDRRANGIPLHREVIDWFNSTTDDLGVARLETMW